LADFVKRPHRIVSQWARRSGQVLAGGDGERLAAGARIRREGHIRPEAESGRVMVLPQEAGGGEPRPYRGEAGFRRWLTAAPPSLRVVGRFDGWNAVAKADLSKSI